MSKELLDHKTANDLPDRNGQHHPIAEFLYQLTKLLTDDNSEIIEWCDGRIKVHHPERLEGEVLHKYFRHSKFASFQRQLNYFGFRKIAGKGKMSPCSYVNEAATSDIRSLLLIKRKTNGSAARKAAMQERAAAMVSANAAAAAAAVNPLAGAAAMQLNFNPNALNSAAMALLSENAMRASMTPNQAAAAAQLNLLALQQQHQRIQTQLLEQQSIVAQQQQKAAQYQQHEQAKQLLAAAANNAASAMPSPGQVKQESTTSAPAPTSNSTNKVTFAQEIAYQQHPSQEKPPSPTVPGAPAPSSAPTIEQLQAHLKAALGQPQPSSNIAAAAAAFLGQPGAAAAAAALLGSSNLATAALTQQQAQMPATAAMEAASAPSGNPFESAANLKKLLEEHKAAEQQSTNPSNGSSNNPLLNRLPSQSTIFPDQSTLSFGNLLGSSNRLSSLLSLNSFLGSREPSLADFAAAAISNAENRRE